MKRPFTRIKQWLYPEPLVTDSDVTEFRPGVIGEARPMTPRVDYDPETIQEQYDELMRVVGWYLVCRESSYPQKRLTSNAYSELVRLFNDYYDPSDADLAVYYGSTGEGGVNFNPSDTTDPHNPRPR